MLPRIGSRVLLLNQDAPPCGIVKEYRFTYSRDYCHSVLICDEWHPDQHGLRGRSARVVKLLADAGNRITHAPPPLHAPAG
jgi:hypothetical protein